jgi:hypothetical protein
VNTLRARDRGVSPAEPVVVVGALSLALVAGVLVTNQGVLAIFAVLGIVFGLVVLRWPFVGFLVLVGSIAVENLLVIQGASGPATGSRLLGMLVFGAWLVGKLVRREPLVPLLTSALMVTAALLFAFALASTIWARVPQAALSGSIQLAQFIALGLLTLDLARSWGRMDLVIKALVAGATLASLFTVYQAVFGGARRAGHDVSGGINETAMLLVTILPFAFYLLRSQTRVAWQVLGITYIGVAVTATIVTYSRMNLLVLPVILALLTIHTVMGRRGRRPILITMIVATGVALYAVPLDRLEDRLVTIVPYLQDTIGAEESGIVEPSARGYHMLLGLAIARDMPVGGAGFRNYGYLFRDEYQFFVPGPGRVYRSVRSPHGSHVGMLANLGGIGFGLWIALLFGAGLIPALRTWRHTAHDRNATPHLMAQAISYALGLQVFVYGWYGNIDQNKLLWIILGLAVAAWALARPADPRSVGKPRRDSRAAQHHRTMV